MALSPNIILEKNLSSGTTPWVILMKISLPDAAATILRFAQNTEDVTFDGDLYTAFPFQLEPITQEVKGQIATVLVHISNITRYIHPYLEALLGGMGTRVRLTAINTGSQEAADIAAYEETSMEFTVVDCSTDSKWVTFTLGAPNPLIQRFPLDKYLAEHCNSLFKDVVCGYTGAAISGITLTGTDPVVITTTAVHGMITAAIVDFESILGTTELNGNAYAITYADTTSFTLDGTDSSLFTAYISDGIVGHASCNRNLSDCYLRNNSARFNNFPALRSGGVRFAY